MAAIAPAVTVAASTASDAVPAPASSRGGDAPRAIELRDAATKLYERLAPARAASYLAGKTSLRNEVMRAFDCSALRAEQVVDSLVAHGMAVFHAHPAHENDRRFGHWRIERPL